MLANNPTSQNETEAVDNRVQVLKTVPVNLSIATDHQEPKREQLCSSTVETPANGSPTAVAMVKAEVYAPVFMSGPGLHYRVEAEDRVAYEQSQYEVTTINHSSYGKGDQQSPPDSPYEAETEGVSPPEIP